MSVVSLLNIINFNKQIQIKKGDIYESKKAFVYFKIEILGKTKKLTRNAIGFKCVDNNIIQSRFVNDFFSYYQKLNNVINIKSEGLKAFNIHNY